MGCIAAIDMGIVILRLAIFDRHNTLFPPSMRKSTFTYFHPQLSFYSFQHCGTFHFVQFNILQADEFMQSPEFKCLLTFLNTHTGTPNHLEAFLKQLKQS